MVKFLPCRYTPNTVCFEVCNNLIQEQSARHGDVIAFFGEEGDFDEWHHEDPEVVFVVCQSGFNSFKIENACFEVADNEKQLTIHNQITSSMHDAVGAYKNVVEISKWNVVLRLNSDHPFIARTIAANLPSSWNFSVKLRLNFGSRGVWQQWTDIDRFWIRTNNDDNWAPVPWLTFRGESRWHLQRGDPEDDFLNWQTPLPSEILDSLMERYAPGSTLCQVCLQLPPETPSFEFWILEASIPRCWSVQLEGGGKVTLSGPLNRRSAVVKGLFDFSENQSRTPSSSRIRESILRWLRREAAIKLRTHFPNSVFGMMNTDVFKKMFQYI